MILLDTNILARVAAPASPQGQTARAAVRRLLRVNGQIVIVPQNLYEFWVVATRSQGGPPAGQNGLGLSSAASRRWMDFFTSRFLLLPEPEELLARWRGLIESHDVRWCARS